MKKKLTEKQINDLKISIEQESTMLKKVRLFVQYGVLVAIVSIIFLFTWLKQPGGWHAFCLVIAIISSIFAVFSILSYIGGRKHLLAKINLLDSLK